MTTLEAGAFVGVVGGAFVGAMLCKPHGVLAETGGAIGGGIVGLFVGVGLGFVQAIAKILAKIYWEVLTGRRKLPSVSSSTKSHRRRVFMIIAVILSAFSCIMGCIYFTGSDAQRSRVLGLAGSAFGLSFIGVLILLAMYRRYPARKEDGKDK